MIRLTEKNAQLRSDLESYEKAKTELYSLIKNHFKPNSSSLTKKMNNNDPHIITSHAPTVSSIPTGLRSMVDFTDFSGFGGIYQGFTAPHD